jgi:hypothetical protein
MNLNNSIEKLFVFSNIVFWFIVAILYLFNSDGFFLSRLIATPYVLYIWIINLACTILAIIVFLRKKFRGENFLFEFSLPHKTVQMLVALTILNVVFRNSTPHPNYIIYQASIVLFALTDSFLIRSLHYKK